MTSFWQEKIKFKNLTVPRMMSAPIDGFLDSPFRQLTRNYSKEELLWGQMRHVASVAHMKKVDELNINKIEHPFCFQLSANSTNFVEKAVLKILEQNFAMINLNSGCPAKKIVNSGTGAALMADIKMLSPIITLIKKTIEKSKKDIPFTIKIRAGFKEKNALEIAQISQDLGIDGIIIHPRLKTQGFSGELDYDLVKKIKQKIKLPIIFSGDVIDHKTAKKTRELTGVDGIMIGRALYGAPWKLEEIKQNLLDNNFEISDKEKIKVALEHLRINSLFYGDKVGFNMLKKHIPMYVKNLEGAALIRKQLVQSTDAVKMKSILKKIIEEDEKKY